MKAKRVLTAAEVKAIVIRQCGKIDKTDPYYRKAAIAKDQAQTAVAYLTDDRYEVSPRAATAIRNWAAGRANSF